MKTVEVRARNSAGTATGTVSITDRGVRAAIAQYDLRYSENDYPRTSHTTDIKTRLQNDAYKYAIRYEDRCCPAKETARLAVGPRPPEGFTLAGGSRRGSVV